MTANAGDSPLPRGVAWVIAVAATLTMTVSLVDRSTLAVLAPTVTQVMGISETSYGWLAGSFSLAYLIMTPLSGRWIDRVGARRGLVGSVLVWSTVAALHAVAPSFAVLFALRVALGAAESPSFPGTAQTLQRVLPPSERARGYGVLFTGSSLGGMLAPPLASFLFKVAGWRFAFLGTAAAGLVWVPLWIVLTRAEPVARQLDAAGPSSDEERRATFTELLRNPATIRTVLVILAVSPMVAIFNSWGSKLLVSRFAITQANVGHYLWLPPLATDAGALLFGDFSARQLRAAGVAPRGLYAVAIMLAAVVGLLPLAETPWQAMTIAGIACAGGGATFTLITADMLGRMPARSVSAAGGILAASQSIAFIVANPLIGAAVDRYHDYNRVALFATAWMIPGAAFWWLRAAAKPAATPHDRP